MCIGTDGINGVGTSEWHIYIMSEGALNVQCERQNTLVCGTCDWWTYTHQRSHSDWLDVEMVVETVGYDGAKDKANFCPVDFTRSSMLVTVAPDTIPSEGAQPLSGVKFGCWLQDYRSVYVGTSASLQPGNIETSSSNVQMEATHSACRRDEVCRLVFLPLKNTLSVPGSHSFSFYY